MRTLLLFVLTASMTFAQETRRTVTNPHPADDARPNSDQVPDVYAITGHFDRVVVLRFKYKTDLLAGLQKMVKQEHIQNGVILSAVGSVRGYQVHQVTNRTLPTEVTYEKNPTSGEHEWICHQRPASSPHDPGDARQGHRGPSGTGD